MSYIGKIQDYNGTNHSIASTLFGTCSTGASTAEKAVTCADFDTALTDLPTGLTIKVKFTNSNIAASPTLNINSKGAKSICAYGTTAPGTTTETTWNAGAIVSFTYDGTNWIMNDYKVSNTDSNTTYTLSAGTNNGTLKLTPSSGSAQDNVKVTGWDNKLSISNSIFENANLNNYTDSGIYQFNQDPSSPVTYTNAPNNAAQGWLLVMKLNNANIKQIWFNRGTSNIVGIPTENEVYTRMYTGSGWGSWNAHMATTNIDVSGQNINNYKNSGIYTFSADITPTNAPSGVANGWLLVSRFSFGTGDTDNVKQFWFRLGTKDVNDGQIYTRTYVGGNWSSWTTVERNVSPVNWVQVPSSGTAPAETNLNSYYTGGKYFFPWYNSTTYYVGENHPITDADMERSIVDNKSGFLHVYQAEGANAFSNLNHNVQIWYNCGPGVNDHRIYSRCSGATGGWTGWCEHVLCSYPVATTSNVINLNKLRNTGIYYINYSNDAVYTNLPVSKIDGWVLCLANPANEACRQIFFRQGSHSGGTASDTCYKIYSRTYSSGSWSKWCELPEGILLS